VKAAIIRFLELWWFWIDWGSLALALSSIPSVLMRRRGQPLSAISWILALASAPILGLLCWWVFGRMHLERRKRRRRRAHQAISAELNSLRAKLPGRTSLGESTSGPGSSEAAPAAWVDASNADSPMPAFKHLPPDLARSVFAPTSGNEVQLCDSHGVFDRMTKDIREAKHHIHALFYIWKNDETGQAFCKALIERAKAGVKVRVLCDAIGSPVMATKFVRPLRKAGVKVARFLPPQLLSRSPRINFRNHRKIFVVDGVVGYVGGFNIGDEYRKTWRDMGIRIRGPAVDQLQEIFADDWYYATNENIVDRAYFVRSAVHVGPDAAACATIASGPDTRTSPIHDALFMAMNETKERLYIMTPYFIPTRAISAALRAAVYRGVDVRILLPAKNDLMLVRYAARSYYPELLEIGVRIFEYQPSMMHAKMTVFDRELTLVGSANIDNRSFRLNFEVSCFVASERLNAQLAERFFADLESCHEVQLAEILTQPLHEKLLDATAHLLSPLL
jgi:cardiolipin synthase A/B